MILYLDTSAVVPLVILEPTSSICGELWDAADSVACTRLLYVEAVAAVAQAERLGRISARQRRQGLHILDDLWECVDIVELDHALMGAAASMALTHGLRGYDAAHCAAAAAVSDRELVAASGDTRLLAAWRAEGLAVVDVIAQ